MRKTGKACTAEHGGPALDIALCLSSDFIVLFLLTKELYSQKSGVNFCLPCKRVEEGARG